MVRLWIDDRECDISAVPTIPINFRSVDLTDVEGGREGRTIEVVLPSSPANDEIFAPSLDIYATARFNMQCHFARLEVDGVTILEGVAHLLASEIGEESRCYMLRISDGGADWVEQLAKRGLDELPIEFERRLDLTTISSTWEGDSSVRFLPIYRNNFAVRYSSESDLAVERVLSTDDYHPFISVSDMVKGMFADTGYELKSNFLDSEFARSLYMSGDYTRSDSESIRSKCDFFARRSAPVTATADFVGRVYASTSVASHSVGAVVDTVDADAVDSDGVVMSETFAVGNSFSLDDSGNACFTPAVTARVGFVLHAEYTTDYRILNRERLLGFDTIEGLNGVCVEFNLTNSCEDLRGKVMPNFAYRAIVFDHREGREYSLMEYLPNGDSFLMGRWSERSSMVYSSGDDYAERLQLLYRDSSSDLWNTYAGDWALYAGYIGEEGRVDVEVDIRFAPQEVRAGEKLVLDEFWFGGAEMGMALTLGNGTTLRPYFTNVPGCGSTVEFAGFAPKQVKQLELLSAVGKMFNLGFYTDKVRGVVYIEPLEELYRGADVVDWSSRIDYSQIVRLADVGVDAPQATQLSYLNADLASHKYNEESGEEIGVWSFANPLYATKPSTRKIVSPLFTTTLNISGVYAAAPTASILQVGDVDSDGEGADKAFTSRIVCYKGLRSLPKGEHWGSTTVESRYPYAAFVDESDINLCYETRNGIEGLHRFYLPMLHRQRDRQYLTLHLHLTPAEIASLPTDDGLKPSWRSRYRFTIGGESSLYRLAELRAWSAESATVECCFERELTDGKYE